MKLGVWPVGAWCRAREGKALINFGATFENPARYSDGIAYVIVNGVVLVAKSQPQSGVFPGRGLRR